MTRVPQAVSAPADRLESWLFDTALPFWATRGFDGEAGGFHERLDCDRNPIFRDGKRAMVQARQIYVFAQAFLLGRIADGADLARAGQDFLEAHYRHPGGGWRHRVARNGMPVDDTRDLYTHAFILFALAWLHRLDSRDATRARADETMEFLDRAMAHPAGGYRETIDGDGNPIVSVRRQNPHMHLFEAFLEWYEVTRDEIWLERAQAVTTLLTAKFCVDGALREYFTDGLIPLPSDQGRLVEPGHHYEWTWLLHRYRRLSGDTRHETLAATLYRFAEEHGVDPETDCVFDIVAADGAPRRQSRRLWPQTEAIKAHIARLRIAGDRTAENRLGRQIESLCRTHVDGAPDGAWREHLGEDGGGIVTDLPASSLYHITLAVAELIRLRAP